MANIALFEAFDVTDFWASMSGVALLKTSTEYRFLNSSGYYVSVTGTGLTYAGELPSAGTYTGITVYKAATFAIDARVATYTSVTAIGFANYFLASLADDGTFTGFEGLAGNDIITGSEANEFGQGGDDFLFGGGGSDTFDGQTGEDVYVINGGDTIDESGFSGYPSRDTVYSSASIPINFLGPPTNSIIDGGEIDDVQLLGSAHIDAHGTFLSNTLYGNAGNNQLFGHEGHDYLDGGIGADTLVGGLGSDSFVMDANDTVSELADQGTDTIYADGFSINLANYSNIENVSLLGNTATTATGTAAANSLSGYSSSGANLLVGLGGDDIYELGAGDTLMEAAGGGDDTVATDAFSIDLTNNPGFANVEHALLGGTSAFFLRGTNSANRLAASGNTAANTLIGLGGNDTYQIGQGDSIVEAIGGGVDLVSSDLISLDLRSYANVEYAMLLGNAQFLNAIGNTGANRIDGESNTQANTLTGLGGNDTYYIGNGDQIVEAVGGGTDWVFSTTRSIDLGQFANVENVVLNGSLGLSATGNDGANDLQGDQNSAANVLVGLGGNDTYFVGAGDSVIEQVAGGNGDEVLSGTISLNLANYANVEEAYVIGALALSVMGTSGKDLIGGEFNSAANILTGLGGDDSYNVGVGDRAVELAAGGYDAVGSSTISINLALHANVEQAYLYGTAALNLTGTAGVNDLYGNSGANRISGLGGRDWIVGRAGKDILTGGTGNDSFVFDTRPTVANRDTITDFNPLQDVIRLDHDIFAKILPRMSSVHFWKGAAAHDANDRIIYNSATGALIYDSNGSAAGGAVQFATVGKKLAMTWADFVMV